MSQKTIHFLALGDSYTIGESVAGAQRWPLQLAAALRARGLAVAEPLIIARTGWTSGELLTGIQRAGVQGPFDLVSLLVGVNNQYRGLDMEAYRREFHELLEQAITFAGGDPYRVIVLSIPDWGVTPFAGGRDRQQIAAEIDNFNAVNYQESREAGVHYLDVTPDSRRAALVESLIAPDGLHPSGEMYASWVALALPVTLSVLGEQF